MPLVLPDINAGLGGGDPHVFLPGTGTSAPRGIEVHLRYNGLILNDRTKQDAYIVNRIEGLDGPDVRDSREVLPSSHGEIPLDSLYGGRTLVLTGRIRSGTLHKLRDMQQALRTAFIARNDEKKLYFKTGSSATDHFINCRLSSKLQWGEEQRDYNMFNREFQITLRASNPRFFSHREFVGRVTPADVAEPVPQIELINSGNFEAQPRIRFSGSLEGVVRIINETTGESIGLKASETISSGTWYEADSTRNTFRDNDGENVFGLLDADTEFIRMVPGKNVLVIDPDCESSEGDGYIDVIYRHAWI